MTRGATEQFSETSDTFPIQSGSRAITLSFIIFLFAISCYAECPRQEQRQRRRRRTKRCIFFLATTCVTNASVTDEFLYCQVDWHKMANARFNAEDFIPEAIDFDKEVLHRFLVENLETFPKGDEELTIRQFKWVHLDKKRALLRWTKN